MEFSPDGRYLAVAKSDQRVEIWDLSLIRERLDSLGLAGGFPDLFAGAEPASSGAPIDRIEVRGADAAGLRFLAARHALKSWVDNLLLFFEGGLSDPEELFQRGNRWQRLGYWKLAAADYRASLARRPSSAETANELAWALVVFPGRGSASEALGWARKAVDLEPRSISYHNTLGVALYRAGLFRDAIGEFERNLAQDNPIASYDLIYLSMCRQRLGQSEEARAALAQVRQWESRKSPMAAWDTSNQLNELVREAQSLLDGSLDPLPADVFAHE
jgi:tetratricopeptide (TPR) repeat protein